MSITKDTFSWNFMHYYKKVEVAETYGVNPRTVTRWIEEARQGKLGLDLQKGLDGKSYIAKSLTNQRLMSDLAAERRKYLNKNNLKTVKPLDEFYDIYSEEQIIEIISGIETYREIPLKFCYFREGAHSWDAFAHQQYNDPTPNTLTETIELINANFSYLDTILRSVDKVNVVDVGVGNALPSRKLLEHLMLSNRLNRYVAIDISEEMLEIAKANIRRWFDGKINFEGYVNDISFEPFADVIIEPPGSAINLVLLLGGTLSNFEAPEDALRVVRKSMGRDDLFIYVKKLDSPLNRERFSVLKEKKDQLLPPQCEYVLGLLGIEPSHYSIESGYSENERARYRCIRLKQALTIDFHLSRGDWSIDFNKADMLMVWRAAHTTASEIEGQLIDSGFGILQASQTLNHDYMMVIADLRKGGR